MVNYYEVFMQGQSIGVFRGLSESDVVNQAYMKTGSASLYTGNARHHYTARKL